MTEQLVWVITTPSCVEFDAARPLAEELAKEVIDSKGGTWVISQSLAEQIVFETYTGQLPANFERSIAGRVFSQNGELRWLREGVQCRTWLIVETEGCVGAIRYRRRPDRKYYLWGMYTKDGTFESAGAILGHTTPRERRGAAEEK